MTTVKNESLGSVFVKDGRLKWIHINSNAIPKKGPEPIGPTSSPKTSVFPRTPREKRIALNYLLGPGILKKDHPNYRGNHWESMDAYKAAADELYWKYRAQKVIIQNLQKQMMILESKILDFRTGQRSNTMNLRLPNAASDKAPTTLETGQTPTSNAS